MKLLNLLKKFLTAGFFSDKRLKIAWIAAELLLLGLILWLLLHTTSVRHAAYKQVYLIGRDSSWYSLQLYGREHAFHAFMNDLMAAVAAEAGFKYAWADTSPSNLIAGLNAEQYDAVLSTLPENIVNGDIYLFSDLICAFGPVLIVRADSPIHSLKELDGKFVGFIGGSSLMFNMLREKGAHEFDLTMLAYLNETRVLDALSQGQVEAVLLDAIPAYTLVEGLYKDKLKIMTPPLTDEGLHLLALYTHSSEHLVENFNASLEKLKKEGVYHSLIEKWNLIDPETKFLIKESQGS
jgi:polar amino acid transport system substrate-binding protein